MPVVHIANKYLHSYNMKHNPDYRKSFAQDKMDRDKQGNYDHQDDNKNYYYSNDNSLANNNKYGSNEDNVDNQRVRRPTPTNFKDLTPTRKKYSQTDFNSNKNQMQDSSENRYSKKQSFRPYDYKYLNTQKGQRFSNYEKEKPKYEESEDDVSSMSDYNHRDNWDLKPDFDPKDYTSPSPTFDHFPVKRKDEMSKYDQIYDDGTEEGNLDFLNGVQKGFNSFDPHNVNNKHANIEAQEEKKNVYKQPYQSSQNVYRAPTPSPKLQYNSSPSNLKRPYKRQVGRPIIEGQKARNFFPKTNERQPHVDVNGFGPSFNTRFFDALDLHSGFFDHNFPGSPAAEDYKLNFNKPNPQFNKVSCHMSLRSTSSKSYLFCLFS